MGVVFLSGAYLPHGEARVSVDDRGFTFGDGVYEVTPVYHGTPFELDRRLDRLRSGVEALRIEFDVGAVEEIYSQLLDRNDLRAVPMAVLYLQVTRGIAPRAHAFPPSGTPPTVYGFARAFERPSPEAWAKGASAITVSDTRWGRVDVKTLQLLPNALAQDAALRAGADEAIFVRDGIALEGARSNLFLVSDGVLRTHPRSNQILPGISRAVVLDLARDADLAVEECPTPSDRLFDASEVFLTGSTSEVLPLVEIDGNAVGGRVVGPVARKLQSAFLNRVGLGSAA